MLSLNLPPFEPKIRKSGESLQIWDSFRRRYVVLTPEEWVRQHLLLYLVLHLGYPEGSIGVEASLHLGRLARRADALVFDRLGNVRMVIETKAAHIAIDQSVFEQIENYNRVYEVDYLLVSNGIVHRCFKKGDKRFDELPAIPDYQTLLAE